MARLVVGDIQGCYDELLAIVEQAGFDPEDDELWIVGDVVNRGPRSLDVLRWLYGMRDSVVPVLGNHDLHLLAVAFGGHRPRNADSFGDLLEAEDAPELLHWLRSWPLIHFEPEGRWLLVHAGIPHIWSVDRAVQLSSEVHDAIRGPDYVRFFRKMYGDRPEMWRDDLEGMDRLRAITNYLTRMRLIDGEGRLNLTDKEGVKEVPKGFFPWYTRRHADNEDVNILFGHWASINGETGVEKTFALDTGCVWGRRLTAYRIDDGAYFACPCLG
jgi:bis(5'-nucleosyl)-tetraphosphatase (symmetrical)